MRFNILVSIQNLVIGNAYLLCVLLLSLSTWLHSQDLVPNSSFEDYIDFDTAGTTGWHKVQSSDTPDYFNLSKEHSFNDIFDKYIGGTRPKSGDAFTGIFCYRVQPFRHIRNIREYIETSLGSKLEKDSMYRIQISLCLDSESNTAVQNFGVYFSGSSNVNNPDFKTFRIRPQVEFNSSFLENTKYWVELTTMYKAGGFEEYMVLGNFRADRSTGIKAVSPEKVKGKRDKWGLTNKERSSYYYLDDVIIEKVSLPGVLPDTLLTETDENVEAEPGFDISKIEVDSVIVLKNIQFEFNKSELLPQSYREIDRLFQLMKDNPAIRVKLEGHTDNIGDYDFNLGLSVRRVEAVSEYLISKGIDPERIEYAGYSFSFPLVPNDTDEGRAKNRRVAFKIIQK